jgi:uncharacterized membrane-anchored protein
MGAELERFAENTLRYIQPRGTSSSTSPTCPRSPGSTSRAATSSSWCAARSTRTTSQLLRRSGYLAEQKPVLIAVDGGADALLEIGASPT